MLTSGEFGDGQYAVPFNLYLRVTRPPSAAVQLGIGAMSGQVGGKDGGPGGRELLGLGLAIAVAVLVPLFAGIGVDAVVHSSPIGLGLGLALGVTLASLTVFRQFRRYL